MVDLPRRSRNYKKFLRFALRFSIGLYYFLSDYLS